MFHIDLLQHTIKWSRLNSNQMCTTMLLYLAVCAERQQECGLSILRQLNKVISLQHHETKSFSSPHHCLSTAFQVCVCVWVCPGRFYLVISQAPGDDRRLGI